MFLVDIRTNLSFVPLILYFYFHFEYMLTDTTYMIHQSLANRNKLIYLLVFFSFIFSPMQRTFAMEPLVNGKIHGQVFDKNSQNSIEYATIVVYEGLTDEMVTGTISQPDGSFEIDQLESGSYYVLVSFIGFVQKRFDQITIDDNNRQVDLGEIFLEPDAQVLNEVEIVAEHHSIDYQIDKKVISVNQMLSSASMSAVEILENVPSIRVDIEGNVSLRGSSGITVLIDGRPTILDASDVLSQIPASSIQSIEIITNPSAKYEPDGTGGIINVITKKQRSLGLQGIINGSTNSFGMLEGDLLLNYNTGKVNFYVGGQYGKSPRFGESYDERRTTRGDTTTRVESSGEYERNRNRFEVKLGADWQISSKDQLAIEANLGNYSQTSSSTLNYLTTRSVDDYRLEELNSNESSRGGRYQGLSSNYLHRFGPDNHQLAIQANYRFREGKEYTENLLSDVEKLVNSGTKSTEDGPSSRYDLKLDYSLPLAKDRFVETGFQMRNSLSTDITKFYLYDVSSSEFKLQDELNNETEYDRNILALYGIYKADRSKFGYQLGLRTEYTDREIRSASEDIPFVIDRWDFFPTVHFSYKLPGQNQLMASYARRIDRPRGYYLEPFITWTDMFNLRQGNPAILPEYIDGYELGYIKEWEDARFSAEVYYRIQYNKIERFQEVYTTGVLLTTYDNVGTDYALGIETMFNMPLFPWWDLTFMGNVYDYRIKGERNEDSFEYKSFNWSSRLDNSFRVMKKLRFQLNGQYNSPTVNSQGRDLGYYDLNAAVRADFLDDKLSVVFQVRDIFGTHRHISIAEDTDFYNYRKRTMNGPIFSLSLSYKINNFKQQEGRRGDGDSNEGGNEMNGDFEG